MLREIRMIGESFRERYISFAIPAACGGREIHAGLRVPGLADVSAEFRIIDTGNSTDIVSVHIRGLITGIPEERRTRAMKACNVLNRKIRFLKFSLDTAGNVCGRYDFFWYKGDDRIGEMSAEIFERIEQIIMLEYHTFTKAIRTDEEIDIMGPGVSPELIREYREHGKPAGEQESPDATEG